MKRSMAARSYGTVAGQALKQPVEK